MWSSDVCGFHRRPMKGAFDEQKEFVMEDMVRVLIMFILILQLAVLLRGLATTGPHLIISKKIVAKSKTHHN